jgi:hypothetical protein
MGRNITLGISSPKDVILTAANPPNVLLSKFGIHRKNSGRPTGNISASLFSGLVSLIGRIAIGHDR